jgi:hypothetical protein
MNYRPEPFDSGVVSIAGQLRHSIRERSKDAPCLPKQTGGNNESASTYWNIFPVVRAWLSRASVSRISTSSPGRNSIPNPARWSA